MKTTIFDFRKPHKQSNITEYEFVELEKVITNYAKPFMSYIDVDGIEKTANGGFVKRSDGSYVMNKTEIDKYDIYEKTTYTYKDVSSHFSYIDVDGNERTFNRPESLMFNDETQTFFGEVGVVEYNDEEVELFTKD